MQETRRYILEILRERKRATVDDIVEELQARRGKITPVTVRHHLSRLQQDDLISTPKLRHRSSPGRPQHVYELSDRGKELFPSNYQQLAQNLLEEMHKRLEPTQVNVILEGVADHMAEDASIPTAPMPQRIEMAVSYLTEHGYEAVAEETENGYLLHTKNCPYHHIAEHDESLCGMDMRLIASLLGVVPRMTARVTDGDPTCSYFIPANMGEVHEH